MEYCPKQPDYFHSSTSLLKENFPTGRGSTCLCQFVQGIIGNRFTDMYRISYTAEGNTEICTVRYKASTWGRQVRLITCRSIVPKPTASTPNRASLSSKRRIHLPLITEKGKVILPLSTNPLPDCQIRVKSYYIQVALRCIVLPITPSCHTSMRKGSSASGTGESGNDRQQFHSEAGRRNLSAAR